MKLTGAGHENGCHPAYMYDTCEKAHAGESCSTAGQGVTVCNRVSHKMRKTENTSSQQTPDARDACYKLSRNMSECSL